VSEDALRRLKQSAVAEHSRKAAEFAERYSRLNVDPYESCFAYSRHRLQKVMERLLPERGEGLGLLDVGCGTGHHLARLRQQGFEVAGLDGSQEMVSLARANNPGVVIRQGDVEALPFLSGGFDVVLCVEVLRYLPGLSECLQEMARVLKPGGLCLATATPVLNLNGYWLINRLASRFSMPGLTRLRQAFFTSSRLRREFEAAGFERPRVHGVYFGPVNWVERLAPRVAPAFLRRWERLDSRVADRPGFRELSNMFLVHAVRGGGAVSR
jgi:2-polyprenyl-3-methyl-5-hydroxy-6-metoxy-1,4-benzoquinol methylase